jgi:hypothetical protein
MQVRQLSFHVHLQQVACLAPAKTIGEQSEKHGQLFAQPGNLLERHLDDPP